MTTPEWAEPYLHWRDLERESPGGEPEFLVIAPQLFSLRLAVATPTSMGEHWCFTTLPAAFVAFLLYPDVPEGWTRHMKANGEMEYPNG